MEASFSDLLSNVSSHLEGIRENSSDNSADNSPSTTNFNSLSSPKRRRAIQKKVVNIPIKDLEGSKFKSDCTPPSDSWAWRKYGQKPIKGSPYPRGYYRCSSSKGCPARKQVERSRIDPSMLVVTYSYEHNHPWPTTSRNHHHNRGTTAITTATTPATTSDAAAQLISTTIANTTTNSKIIIQNNSNSSNNNHNHNNNNNKSIQFPQNNMEHLHQPLMAPPIDDLTWLSSDHEILQNDFIFNTANFNDLDMAKFFPMREEDESLFADLGELPECPVVFRKTGGEEQPCNLTPWCGSTG